MTEPTWEKLWHFAPMARIWDKLWVDRQLIITNLEVIDDGDSHSLLITSGRCVLSVDAKEGKEQWRFTASAAVWRMVTFADLNDDGADEVFAGSDDGRLYLVNGKTGVALWRTKLPEHEGVNYNDIEHQVSDIVILDEESGKAAVASGDGWIQMYDLVEKRRGWETPVFEIDQAEEDGMDHMVDSSSSQSEDLLLSLAADVTGDGLPEVLMTKAASSSQYRYSVYTNDGKAALCDSTGNMLWQKDAIACSNLGIETGTIEGKPVFLETGTGEITLIDLRDGESVLHTIPLGAVIDPGLVVWQPGGDGYLTFSSTGDLAAITAKGELLWYYPRIASVKTENGNFVGDTTEDVLFCGESATQRSSSGGPVQDISQAGSGSMTSTAPSDSLQNQNLEVRLLMMMDGATRTMAWSYEVPYGEFKSQGGLKGIQVTPDMVGSDNVPDIAAYRGDTVFVFSGRDGTRSSFPAGQPIASLEVIRNGASGNAFALTTPDPAEPFSRTSGTLLIVDRMGAPLCTTTAAEWVGVGSGSFMVLDDVNSDNVSDLAVVSTSKIVILKSMGSAEDYGTHLTLEAEAGCSIEYTELVPDANRDGVRDLAYIQRAAVPPGQMLACPLLLEKSATNGDELLRTYLPAASPAIDLACGDFDGDGHADSLLSSYSYDICGTATPSEQGYSGTEVKLSVLSGWNGTIVWTHYVETQQYVGGGGWGNRKPPAANTGDVTGDGKDDLAWTVDSRGQEYSGYYCHQQSIEVYDVAHDESIRVVPATPLLMNGLGGYGGSESSVLLPADLDGDGRSEVLTAVSEPSMSSNDLQYFAVVDTDSGRHLAGFTGFDAETISLFESHQPGILGVTGCGGVCYLHISSDLQVTSPEDEARTGPTVEIKWDGPTYGDFCQVFVDGVRNDITNAFESELVLARGNHAIVVWSVDDYGRISYSPSDLGAPLNIKVRPSPWKPVLLVLSLFLLLAFVLALFYARLQRARQARKRVAK